MLLSSSPPAERIGLEHSLDRTLYVSPRVVILYIDGLRCSKHYD